MSESIVFYLNRIEYSLNNTTYVINNNKTYCLTLVVNFNDGDVNNIRLKYVLFLLILCKY